MRDMSTAEYQQFMTEEPRTGKLATVGKDGRPHVTPIWFIMDGTDLLFTTWHTSVKAGNLRREQRVSLCVDDDVPPYAYVIVEGTVQVQETPDPTTMLHWATEIARRYLGDALAETYGKRNGVPGEWLVRLIPSKIIAKIGIAD
jgi:PPOX class probable F420-dependent enzyme